MFEQAIEAKAMELQDGFRRQIEQFEVDWEKRLQEYDNDVEEAKAKQLENIELERERYSEELQQKLKISNKMSFYRVKF